MMPQFDEPRSVNLLSSAEWYEHFCQNLQHQRIDWSRAAQLDYVEHRKSIRSMQAWQLGETSDGSHLLSAASKYADRFGDMKYLDAVRLFIKEEQKHGENLGKYLDLIGAPRLNFDLGDWLFRRVRYFISSIELWTITVVIVESYAQLYYAALARACNCPLLASICEDILQDEAHHIRFQKERLHRLLASRPRRLRNFTFRCYRAMFTVVTLAVWIGHRHVFQKAGYNFYKYWRKANAKFSSIERYLNTQNGPAFDDGGRWYPEDTVAPTPSA